MYYDVMYDFGPPIEYDGDIRKFKRLIKIEALNNNLNFKLYQEKVSIMKKELELFKKIPFNKNFVLSSYLCLYFYGLIENIKITKDEFDSCIFKYDNDKKPENLEKIEIKYLKKRDINNPFKTKYNTFFIEIDNPLNVINRLHNRKHNYDILENIVNKINKNEI